MKIDVINEIGPDLQEKLWLLKDVPARDESVKARQRAQFAAQLKFMPTSQNSVGLAAMWPFSTLNKNRGQKHGYPTGNMLLGRALVTIALVLVFLFSSVGITAYAAQSSLPSSPIYSFKLFSEDVRLELTTNIETKFSLILAYANKRVEEIVALQSQGDAVDEPVVTRLQDQYEFALQLASGMPDDQMTQSLEQLRETAQTQLMTMTTLRENAPADLGEQLDRVQEMLEQQQYMAQNGLEDPLTFRETMRNQIRNNEPSEDKGNQNGRAASDGPGPSEPSDNGEPQNPPRKKGPDQDQEQPAPSPEEPDEDLQKGNGPGSDDEQQPGKGPGSDQDESQGPEDVLFSNSVGYYVQYGIVILQDYERGHKAKFQGSPTFIP